MKSINKTTLINVASTILLQGIAVITTPIFTRVLGTAQYGIYAVFYSWVTILSCVAGLGVGSSLGTALYHFKNTYYEFRSSILVLGSIISLFMIIAGLLFAHFHGACFGYNGILLVLLFAFAYAHYTIGFAQTAFIYEKRANYNFVLSVGLSVATTVLSLYLINFMGSEMKYKARIFGMAIPYITIAIYVWIILFKKKPIGMRWEYSRYALKMGFPVVFHSLAKNVLSQSDRIMMKNMRVSSSEIGIYSFYCTFIAVMTTILSALNTSWCPFYYDDLEQHMYDKLKIKCKNYIELFSVLIVGFLLLSREVSYFMSGEEYVKEVEIIPILAVSVYFMFMYQFPVNFEFFHKRTRLIAIGTVGAAVLNIILNFIMIRRWGMFGAAAATTISYMALFFLHYTIVKNMKKENFHLKVIAFCPGIVGIIIGVIMFYIFQNMWYLRWLLGFTIGVVELFRMYRRKSIF